MSETWKQWEGRVVNEEFRLLRYLGGSDHSAVFVTERGGQAPQKAAIKLILANSQNPELQHSWWELSAKLSHPHLVRLLQFGPGQLDGTELHYVLMEFAEDNLAQILPQRALTPGEAHEMLTAVLDALTYIHGKGFVHGHIRPTNIMAVSDQIKISSDGLCGAGESSRVLGKTDIYMAPEIASGGGVSPASDVWSLGVTLVEAMTQLPPGWEGTAETSGLVPDTLPAPFYEIAEHCVRREPGERWTVAQVAARLRQVVAAPSENTPSPSPSSTISPKWRYLAVAAGVVAVAILAGSRLRDRHANTEATPTAAVESPQAEPAVPAPPPAPIAKNKEQVSTVPAPMATPERAVKANASSATGTSGAVIQQILPDVARSARNTVHGRIKITVRASVDSSGKVVATKFVTRGPSKYFARLSQQAAERWTFRPPQVSGQDVSSQWNLRFEFTRTSTDAQSTQVSP